MAYDLRTLLDWLAEKSRIFSWDMIVALDCRKLNQLLSQAYISRFDGTGFRKPFTKAIKVEGQEIRFLQNFILDAPRLKFDGNPEKPSMQLRLRVISGNDVVVQIGPESRYVSRVEYIQPIEGPLLTIRVDLTKERGKIEHETELQFTLLNTQERDFNLEFDPDQAIQRLGGQYFWRLFNALPKDEKMFTLGKIKFHENELFRARSFALAVQSDKDSTSGDGAVLAFISMQDGHENVEPPSSDNVFRYMIPAPAEDYSAAAMFNTVRITTVWLVERLCEVLAGQGAPRYRYEDRVLSGANIPGASMDMERGVFHDEIELMGVRVIIDATCEPTTIFSTDADGIQLKRSPKGATLSWPVTGEVEFTIAYKIEDPKQVRSREYATLEKTSTTVAGTLTCEIILEDGPTPKFTVADVQFLPETEAPEQRALFSAGSTVDDAVIQEVIALGWEELWWAMFRVLLYAYLFGAVFLAMMFAYIIGLVVSQFVGALKLISDIDIGKDLSELTGQLIELNQKQVIVGGSLHAPHELVRFGKLAGLAEAPEVSPAETLVAVGDSCQFTLEGAQSGIDWSVEPLTPGMPKVGTINPSTGLYTVPAAAIFAGDFIRERVKATQGQKSSYALVTLARDSLVIAPMFQIVRAGKAVAFSAGSSRPDVSYQWKIDSKAAAAGATLSSCNGQKVQFIAGLGKHDFPELVGIEVTAGGATRAGRVLMLPACDIKTLKIIVDAVDSVSGVMNLKMDSPVFTGEKSIWTIVDGRDSGTVEADRENPRLAQVTASKAPTDPMLSIKVEICNEESEAIVARGYCFLPLPFSEFKAVYQFLQTGVEP